uniref:hypothetical protein n=1 Tax=Pseudonocardia sp. CA-138482 TaxID=3240023 RepID=UPI003F498CFE
MHGVSRYYYDLGCGHKLCRQKAATAKRATRANHKAARRQVNGRWVHAQLAPADSTAAARHGTVYARATFGCECEECRPPGTLCLPFLGEGVAVVVSANRYLVVVAAVLASGVMLWTSRSCRPPVRLLPPRRVADFAAQALGVVVTFDRVMAGLLVAGAVSFGSRVRPRLERKYGR